MAKPKIISGSSGVSLLSGDGTVAPISNDPLKADLEKLIKDRQRIGREISKQLKDNGLQVMSDEATEVIEPD